MSSLDAPYWHIIYNYEMSKFIDRHLYNLIPIDNMPIGLKPIPGKQVFTKKPTPNGLIWYKAQWVVQGNIINSYKSLFTDSTAPVVMESIKIILFTAAAHHRWHIMQANAIIVFLNGYLTSPIYMH